jgi:hypothetical protein
MVTTQAMPQEPDRVSTYVFLCTVPGLREPESSLLAQADCRIQGELVEFNLNRAPDEGSDQLRNRGAQWIGRELSRVNVSTGRLLKATSLRAEPSPGSITIRTAAVWDHQVPMPPSHCGWSDDAVQFRLSAWDVARHTEDPVLRFVMLDAICESASVCRDWTDQSRPPPRFAEVRLIRNLLVHGSPSPNDQCAGISPFAFACLDNQILGSSRTHRTSEDSLSPSTLCGLEDCNQRLRRH